MEEKIWTEMVIGLDSKVSTQAMTKDLNQEILKRTSQNSKAGIEKVNSKLMIINGKTKFPHQ
jgi:hypothetical protein